MADDLGEDWWKASDEAERPDVQHDKNDTKTICGTRKAVKRPAGSASDEDIIQSKKNGKSQLRSGKTKKSLTEKNKHARRKITEEDEDILSKPGSPVDVLSLVKLAQGSGKDAAVADENFHLDPELDFFPSESKHQETVEYLNKILPRWQKTVKKTELGHGCPLLLILTSSAIRAVQLNRDIKSFLGTNCKTAKLFAKHMKMEEQSQFLKKNICQAAIGTPNRVQALLRAGCLKMDSMQAVVLDWNWRDVKLKRLVDIPEVRKDLVWLLQDFVIETVHNTNCKIGLM